MSNYETLEEELNSYSYLRWFSGCTSSVCVFKGRTSALYRRLFGSIYYRKRLDIE